MPGQNKTYCQDESGNYGKTIWQYRWPAFDETCTKWAMNKFFPDVQVKRKSTENM